MIFAVDRSLRSTANKEDDKLVNHRMEDARVVSEAKLRLVENHLGSVVSEKNVRTEVPSCKPSAVDDGGREVRESVFTSESGLVDSTLGVKVISEIIKDL